MVGITLHAWDTSANETEILLSATAVFFIFREDRKGSTVEWEEESWLKLNNFQFPHEANGHDKCIIYSSKNIYVF